MINPEAHREVRSGHCQRFLPRVLLMSAAVVLSVGCATQKAGVPRAKTEQSVENPSGSLLVECVIPPQARRLSSRVVSLSPTQRVRTTAKDCEERGGSWRGSVPPAASLE